MAWRKPRQPPGAAPGSGAQPLWPGGAALGGARFTPQGGFPCVYLASSFETALAEVGAVFARPNAAPVILSARTWALFTVKGLVLNVLELTDSAVTAVLKTNETELTGRWVGVADASTQRLGAAAHAPGGSSVCS